MSSTRGRGGGSRSVTVNKRRRKSGKKLCELGSSCPYQHEYQHQLEFTHDGNTTDTISSSGRVGRVGGAAAGGRGAGRGGRGGERTGSTISSLNGTGTGARGRLLAVAADRRRAERSLQQGVGQDLLNIHGGDAREAQRTRWVMRMQNEVHQQVPAPAPARPRAANSSSSSSSDDHDGREGGGNSPSSSPSSARPSSSVASPCRLRRESTPPGAGQGNTAGTKRATRGIAPTTPSGEVQEVIDLC